MMYRPQTIAVLMALGTLTACGGGGGGGNDPALQPPDPGPSNPGGPTAGIDRGGVAVGVISGFGSVIVNGVRYDTDNATITVDGNPGTEADLSVGQVVTITGTIDDDGINGEAAAIDFDVDVEGPIGSIDLAAGSFVVLGQTVLVSADTAFDDDIQPQGLEGLAVDDIVEVSGFVDADGRIAATYIEREDDTDDFEVEGTVSNLDSVNFTFNIRNLVVDYSGATLEDFGNDGIQDGQSVEVEGNTIGASGELIATLVEREDDDDFARNEGDDGEITGFVTRFVSPTDFDVAGVPVTTNAETEFDDGGADDLALNLRVEVEGSFDANGVLVADEVSFQTDPTIELEGTVADIDVAAGTFTVLGVIVAVNELTQFEDDSDSQTREFGLDDLVEGDFVEVSGFRDPDDDRVIASRIEREDDDGDDVTVKGRVDSISRPDFVVLGITVQTTADTEFEDGDADSFFAALEVGAEVEVEGMRAGPQLIVADEVSLDDDDDDDDDDNGDDEDEGDDA